MVKTGRPALPVESDSFGGQLRKARETAGYKSAQAFADAIPVERPTVNRWESNKVFPPAIAIARINQLLGTDFPIVKKTKKTATNTETPSKSPSPRTVRKGMAEKPKKSLDKVQLKSAKSGTNSE